MPFTSLGARASRSLGTRASGSRPKGPGRKWEDPVRGAESTVDAGWSGMSPCLWSCPQHPMAAFTDLSLALRGAEVCGWLPVPSPLWSPRGKLLCCGNQKDHLCLSLSCCPAGVCWNNHRHASQLSPQHIDGSPPPASILSNPPRPAHVSNQLSCRFSQPSLTLCCTQMWP